MKRWQQNALIASCAWALVATVYLRYQELPKAQAYATKAYYLCMERMAAAGASSSKACLDNVDKDWNAWMNRKWPSIAAVALVPVGLAWLAALAGFFAWSRLGDGAAGKRE